MLSLENPNSPLQQICCHSHRGNKANLLGIGAGLWQAGHNTLLFAPTPGSWQPLPVRARSNSSTSKALITAVVISLSALATSPK